jgi:hypothetical protein
MNLANVNPESLTNTVSLTVATSSATVTDPLSTNLIFAVSLSAVPAVAQSLSSPSRARLNL